MLCQAGIPLKDCPLSGQPLSIGSSLPRHTWGAQQGLQALCLLSPLLLTPPGSLSCSFITIPLQPPSQSQLAPGPSAAGERRGRAVLSCCCSSPHPCVLAAPQGRRCSTAPASSQGAESQLPSPQNPACCSSAPKEAGQCASRKPSHTQAPACTQLLQAEPRKAGHASRFGHFKEKSGSMK